MPGVQRHAAEVEQRLLRRSYELAREARERGDAPFGALLADASGGILLEHANAVATARDTTAHAETGLVRAAAGRLEPRQVAEAVLYTSTEPCAMCTAAIFWAGVPLVVYGCPESHLEELAAQPGFSGSKEHPMAGGAPVLAGGCRSLLRGCNAIGLEREVVGPLLEDEGRAVHDGWWC
eukprot:TRINITY_DN25233_c0_g1_i1.p3 TRINITY_DN25233_c0_g1~~TRINITY_DN25233_c0_g1_i1.p3  ORF type:complete len:208 (+),score=70.78 TRINITY_DN25233_c0_g1_i1:90-626(+)